MVVLGGWALTCNPKPEIQNLGGVGSPAKTPSPKGGTPAKTVNLTPQPRTQAPFSTTPKLPNLQPQPPTPKQGGGSSRDSLLPRLAEGVTRAEADADPDYNEDMHVSRIPYPP